MKRFIIIFRNGNREYVAVQEANNDTQALANFVEAYGTYRTPVAIGQIRNLSPNDGSNNNLYPVTTADPKFRIDRDRS